VDGLKESHMPLGLNNVNDAIGFISTWGCNLYTLPIHELKKGVKLGDTFG